MVDVWWPQRGRMHVAGGKNTGQPERDLGPHSRTIKDSHEYNCALLSKSPPTIYKRLAGTHKKNIAAKWWRRLQQLPLCSAQSGDTVIAQRRTSPILHKLRDSSRTLIFHPIQPLLIWRAANQGAGQSPFSWHDLHRPHYPRKSPFTRS